MDKKNCNSLSNKYHNVTIQQKQTVNYRTVTKASNDNRNKLLTRYQLNLNHAGRQ